jgi:hypothetical protein
VQEADNKPIEVVENTPLDISKETISSETVADKQDEGDNEKVDSYAEEDFDEKLKKELEGNTDLIVNNENSYQNIDINKPAEAKTNSDDKAKDIKHNIVHEGEIVEMPKTEVKLTETKLDNTENTVINEVHNNPTNINLNNSLESSSTLNTINNDEKNNEHPSNEHIEPEIPISQNTEPDQAKPSDRHVEELNNEKKVDKSDNIENKTKENDKKLEITTPQVDNKEKVEPEQIKTQAVNIEKPAKQEKEKPSKYSKGGRREKPQDKVKPGPPNIENSVDRQEPPKASTLHIEEKAPVISTLEESISHTQPMHETISHTQPTHEAIQSTQAKESSPQEHLKPTSIDYATSYISKERIEQVRHIITTFFSYLTALHSKIANIIPYPYDLVAFIILGYILAYMLSFLIPSGNR